MLHRLRVPTRTRSEFVDITHQIEELVRESDIQSGIVYIYCPHTSCGITIQENTDPGVPHDMLLVLNRLVPRSDAGYRHNEDNSASHVQTSMMGSSQVMFIENRQLVLGRWQGVFLCEFDGPRERTVLIKMQPDQLVIRDQRSG